MMTFPGPWSSDPARLSDAHAELADIVSMMAQAHGLDMDLAGWGFDLAVSALLAEADMLWATASARLAHLVRAPLTPEPCAIAAHHLFALLRSDGSNPGQDRHHLRGLASLADTLSRQNRMRAQVVRAVELISQIYADQDPFDLTDAPSPLTSSEQGS